MNPIKSEAELRTLLQDHLTNMLINPSPVDVDYGMSLVDRIQRQHKRELVDIVKAQKEVNSQSHGLAYCKSCGLAEALEQYLKSQGGE